MRKTLALLLLVFVRPAAASELTLCNDGAFEIWAAEATWKNDGFLFLGRNWYVSGWYTLSKDECRVFYDGTARFYVAFSFTDAGGHWGAAVFEPGNDDDWRAAKHELCVARGEFEYKLGDEDTGECPDGYFEMPGTLVYEPGDANDTITLTLRKDDLAWPIGLDDARSAGTRAQPESGGLQTVAEVIGAGIGIAAAVVIANAIDNAGKAPQPFADGTVNARLFGVQIVRRTDGDGEWFNADGKPVAPVFELRGATSSALLDAPTQRPADDAEVAAAVAQLNRGLAGIANNRGARVTSEGRLQYDYQRVGASDLTRVWVNLEALDFARGRRLAGDGVMGFRIPCRDERACVVELEQDDAGKQSSPLLFQEVDIFFASNPDGDAIWAALQKLLSLYPEEPVVAIR